MKYRSRTDIAYEILQAANGGGTKTKIMYKAFISYAQLKEHLTMMLANDLLEFDEKTQIYKTTEKGLSLAKLYDQVGELVSPVVQ